MNIKKIFQKRKVVRQLPYANDSAISDFWKVRKIKLVTGEDGLCLSPVGGNIDLSWAEGYIAKIMEIFKANDSIGFFIIDLRVKASNWKGIHGGGVALNGLPLALVSCFKPGVKVHPWIIFVSNRRSFRRWLNENLSDCPNFNSYIVSSLGESDREIGEGAAEWLKLNISAVFNNLTGEDEGPDVFREFRESNEAPEFLEGAADLVSDDIGFPEEGEAGDESEEGGFEKIKRKYQPRK